MGPRSPKGQEKWPRHVLRARDADHAPAPADPFATARRAPQRHVQPRMLTRRHVLQAGAVLGLAAAAGTRAQTAEVPTADVVLTLSGRLRHHNAAQAFHFDMPMLERLPQASFSTRTPWYAQARRFTGPLLRDVLRVAGAQGRVLRARALNDYRVDIPFDDAQRFDLLLARLLDGTPMPVRDKGPLFAIYPFDAAPELRNATYYSRSAWQLRAIEVL